jgi:AraC-like DNA-binding protein
VHTVESFHPCPELRRYVRAYAQRKMEIANVPLIARVPARLEQILEFQFGDSFDIHFDNGPRVTTPRIAVIGPQTHLRASVEFFGKIDSFGVFFQPAGFSQLFGVPMRTLANTGTDGQSILGQSIRSVWNELGESNRFQERVRIVERFLLKSLRGIRLPDRMVETSNRLLALQGRVSIANLAGQQGMSVRHFERTFVQQVGVAPKVYARIARFQTALDMKVASPRKTWLEISHALDYFDQMHMIRDFKSLGGNSPGRVLEHLGDMRPEAVASSSLNGEK